MKRLATFLLGLIVSQAAWPVVEFFSPLNTATRVPVDYRLNTTGALISGATGSDCEISEHADGGNPATFADATNEATEIATSSGLYYITLTAGETDTDYTLLKCTSTTTNAMPFTARISHKARGVNWGNVINPATSVTLSGTTVGTATALGAGSVNSTSVGTLTGGDLGVGVFATGAITSDAMGAGAINSTSVGTLTGGDLGVGAFAAGAITAASIATDAITETKIAANAIGASEIAAAAINVSEAPNLDAAISTRSSHAATAIVSAGAITTSSGAVSNVTTTATATNVTNLGGIAALLALGFHDTGTTQSQAGVTDIDLSGSTNDELILKSGGVNTNNNLSGYTLYVVASGEDPQPCIIDRADDATDTVSCKTPWTTTPTAGGGDVYAVMLQFGEVPSGTNDLGVVGVLNCEVNTAFYSATAQTFACILTDSEGQAITQASGDLEGNSIAFKTGGEVRETRFIGAGTVWDATNSEFRVTLSRALPNAPSDGDIAIIR